jgi:hypothetical protein
VLFALLGYSRTGKKVVALLRLPEVEEEVNYDDGSRKFQTSKLEVMFEFFFGSCSGFTWARS